MELVRTRKHWIVLFSWQPLALVLLAIGAFAFAHNPGFVVHALHLTTTSSMTPVVRGAYLWAARAGWILVYLALLSEGLRVLAWCFETISVDGQSVTWTQWPNRSESVVLRAIADVRWQKPGILPLMLGYGTLVLDAGRQEETIDHIPGVEHIATAIRNARS